MKSWRQKKAELLREEMALKPAEAAAILGCSQRDLRDYVKPYHCIKNRWKYRFADVLAAREKIHRVLVEREKRIIKMLRDSAS